MSLPKTLSSKLLSAAFSAFFKRNFISTVVTMERMKYTVTERGMPNDLSYRMYFENDEGPISPFHDIPLLDNAEQEIYNMVVEVPRWTNAKMEIATKENLNPIRHDRDNEGKLRYVYNLFPFHGYLWNYGALPQTWEDPGRLDDPTGCRGDNDPLDVLEIGSRLAKQGEVLQIKVLAAIGLIDEGEADWKIIGINVNDPLAAELHNLTDIENRIPTLIQDTIHWLKYYKVPDGKPPNQVAFNEKPKDRNYAMQVIRDAHKSWRKLITASVPEYGVNIGCVEVEDAAKRMLKAKAQKIVDAAPALGPRKHVNIEHIEKWHYLPKN